MILNEKKSYSGFSLIELSIVLIIMGLLVAGITGGASLIKTAQLRSVVTEAETYRTAFNTYYSQAGDVPGAVTGAVGKISASATAWANLKTNGVVGVTSTDGAVLSKFRGAKWYWGYVTQDTAAAGSNIKITAAGDLKDLNVLYVGGEIGLTTSHPFPFADAKNIDDKIDDGVADNGYVKGVNGSAVIAATAYTTGTSSLIIKLDF
jgi:prepilin-type N-terminal cleavage/methylation domain-containing protein